MAGPFLLLLVSSPALATLGDSATSASTFTTTSLAAPTSLVATAGCVGVAAAKVTLTWTATTSTYATGYDIYRAVGAGAPALLTSVSPRTVATYTDTAVSLLTTYTYTVRSKYQNWIKASSSASATTGAVCV